MTSSPGPVPAEPQAKVPARPSVPEWESWDDERLLDVRMCDLRLRLRGSFVEPFLRQVGRELSERGLRLRPHYWLSDEWFCPDGVVGMAIPFYLAHPRLARLERAQMLEVEGGTPDWCLRILRHEVGHAVENAYGLRRRKRRIQLFGKSSEKYPKDYAPRPYSKSFVVNIEAGYAQSHPDEDFAETFAVWLTPGSDWARRYAGWKALRKLEYVDALMKEVAGQEPRIRSRREVEPLRSLQKTLREHYRLRREAYGVGEPELYDRDLRRLFSDAPEHARNPSAARFLSRLRKEAGRRAPAAAPPRPPPAPGPPLDRQLPVPDRPCARRDDRALPGAEPSPGVAGGAGEAGLHGPARRPGGERPAHRAPPPRAVTRR